MKRYLNTLFVSSQGSYLRKEGETVVVEVEKIEKLQVPIHTLDSIVCFGNVLCSPFLLGHCAEHDVTVSMLTENGRFLARVVGPVSGNVLLRREQYRRADCPDASAALARSVVIGKLANCRTVLQRATRDHGTPEAVDPLDHAIWRLGGHLQRLERPLPLDETRGVEGEGAREYFEVFDHLITAQKEDFRFEGRNRRPPRDPVNALLSFLYTLLVHDVRSALEGVGLDPQVGFLHRDRPGRPGLALDLMEEFRPLLADRMALSLINRRQVAPSGFRKDEGDAVVMDEKTRKEVLVAWQERKRTELVHPFLGEKMQMGLVPHIQAQLLARHLRGDLDGYPPFVWK